MYDGLFVKKTMIYVRKEHKINIEYKNRICMIVYSSKRQ